MYGPDVERILLIINKIKDITSSQILALSLKSDYRMETISHTHNVHVESSDGAHGHGSGAHHHSFWLTGNGATGGRGLRNHVSDQLTYPEEYPDDNHPTHPHTESSIIYEREHEEAAVEFTAPIVALGELLGEDDEKLSKLGDELYTGKNTFHNTYGSPWTEISLLKDKIKDLEEYSNNHPSLQWQGEKFAILQLMQVVLSYAIDAKHALTTNHDFIQRGYDEKYNDKQASITWDDFRHGATDGNRDQLTNRTNVRRKSNDPY